MTAEQARVQELQPVPLLGSTVRNADGSVLWMTYSEAVTYCSTRGGLPTAKQLAMALNPTGVSDRPRVGFKRISPKNEDRFYYNRDSYLRPSGEDRHDWFWSSSVYYDLDAFIFDSHYGDIKYVNRDTGNPVRCVGR